MRGRRAAGWQQDQTLRGQSSLKKLGWGVGAAGPQGSRDTLGRRVLIYVTECVCTFDGKLMATCLPSTHIMWVRVFGSICHMDSYTPRLGEGEGTYHFSSGTPAMTQPNNNSLQICESTHLRIMRAAYKGKSLLII